MGPLDPTQQQQQQLMMRLSNQQQLLRVLLRQAQQAPGRSAGGAVPQQHLWLVGMQAARRQAKGLSLLLVVLQGMGARLMLRCRQVQSRPHLVLLPAQKRGPLLQQQRASAGPPACAAAQQPLLARLLRVDSSRQLLGLLMMTMQLNCPLARLPLMQQQRQDPQQQVVAGVG